MGLGIWWSILAATIVSMIVSMLWYGPLFGNAWASLVGLKRKKPTAADKKRMWLTMIPALISTFVSTTVLFLCMVAFSASTVQGAFIVAGVVWLGFFATSLLTPVLWEKKPIKLYLINVTHALATLAVSAIVLFLLN